MPEDAYTICSTCEPAGSNELINSTAVFFVTLTEYAGSFMELSKGERHHMVDPCLTSGRPIKRYLVRNLSYYYYILNKTKKKVNTF